MTNEALVEMGRVIIERVGIPKDRWEIAAQLEVLGLRDGDARTRFGCDDLFGAADGILELFREGKLPFAVPGEDPERRGAPFFRFVQHYLNGLMFALPMVLQGATMLLWGYGLWGAIDLDVRTGSAIALGFVGSYVATSGFAWAIVRRGLFYHYQSEGGLAKWSALRMWWVSVRCALGLGVAAFVFNALYGFLPMDLFFIALAYYAALVLFWLNWALIFLVRRTHWLLAALSVSIAIVVGAVEVLHWAIVPANLAGLAIADCLTFLAGYLGLSGWARNGAGKPAVNPPRLTVLVYSSAQVFLYGTLYSAFIFADRILAWTSTRGREDFPPYAFWLNARYELGMDLALIVVVLLSGLVEHATHQFSARLVPEQKRVKSGESDRFIARFRSFFVKHRLVLAASAIVSIAISALAFDALRRFPSEELQKSLGAASTERVFWVAAVSYAIFMLALQSILVLMTLSRADLAVRAMSIALLVNVVVGFAASRSIHYSGAVFGLLAGSVTLALLAYRSLGQVLDDLDYHYYAAY